jgi:hypothetical protein
MKMKTFKITYIDAMDCLVYEKTMKFQLIEHACAYMRSRGHDIIRIEEI